jgi:hypothetical protein
LQDGCRIASIRLAMRARLHAELVEKSQRLIRRAAELLAAKRKVAVDCRNSRERAVLLRTVSLVDRAARYAARSAGGVAYAAILHSHAKFPSES